AREVVVGDLKVGERLAEKIPLTVGIRTLAGAAQIANVFEPRRGIGSVGPLVVRRRPRLAGGGAAHRRDRAARTGSASRSTARTSTGDRNLIYAGGGIRF